MSDVTLLVRSMLTEAEVAPWVTPEELSYAATFGTDERRREFLFEAKRYFDLVRSARRIGNTQEFRKAMASKYVDASPAVSAKMVQMDFLYMPVLKSEKKANPELEQNSCYLDEEENLKN